MNKAKVLSIALALALVGCSVKPYPLVKNGDLVMVSVKREFQEGGLWYGKVQNKTSDSIVLNPADRDPLQLEGDKPLIIPWSCVKSVTPAEVPRDWQYSQ